jgi:hypothetical protein
MPLDPQAHAFLEQLAAAEAPPLHELFVEDARQVIVELFDSWRCRGDTSAYLHPSSKWCLADPRLFSWRRMGDRQPRDL